MVNIMTETQQTILHKTLNQLEEHKQTLSYYYNDKPDNDKFHEYLDKCNELRKAIEAFISEMERRAKGTLSFEVIAEYKTGTCGVTAFKPMDFLNAIELFRFNEYYVREDASLISTQLFAVITHPDGMRTQTLLKNKERKGATQ